jgi:cation diffusion facilitator family transporter
MRRSQVNGARGVPRELLTPAAGRCWWALSANALVTLAKLLAGLLSGSAAMLAEAVHSLADTANQGFLLVSIALATREPTPEQPFGFGRMRFLWTFVAAISMFIAGATFAVGYGIYQLFSGGEPGSYLIAYLALGVSLAAEGSSWMRAVRQTKGEARKAQVPLVRYVRESRDPNVKMVLFEDTAALVGIALAFVGILLDEVERASDAVDRRLRELVPDVTEVFLDATTARAPD